ncbi:MAG: PAS domain S-box protein [Acidobacteriia bacterium]|nr:PAS domain S-box protein [Terriglobia bacterium]
MASGDVVPQEAEEALRESESRYRTLVELSPDAILVHVDGKVVFANAASVRLFGANDSRALLGRSILDLVHPDTRALVEQRIQLLLEKRRAVPTVEEKLQTLQGKPIEAEVSAVPFVYQGKAAVQVIAHDISARKRSEQQLHLQSTALNSAANAIVIADRSGRVTWVNPAFTRLSGYSFEEVAGQLLSLLKSEHQDPVFHRNLWDTILAGMPWRGEIVNRRKDGTSYVEEMTITPVYDGAGRVSHFIAIEQDVTERKRAQEALEVSEERYRKFFEEDISGDYISTPDGRLLACNPTFLKIFGFSSLQEALSTNVQTLFAQPESRRGYLALLSGKKKLERFGVEFKKRDGTRIYAIESSFGTFDESGNLLEIKGYIFDDTERKRLEEQFLQAQKMEAIGRLAGGVAHDFNNLLTAILGYSDLIQRRTTSDQWLQHHIDEIRKAAERATALTRQLLTFSRKQVIQPKVFNLNVVLTDMEKMLRRLISEDVDLRMDLEPRLSTIKSDPNQIEQVLMNLVINARDAMPHGGRVVIRTENVTLDKSVYLGSENLQPGQYAAITVSDNGSGIDAETLGHVFEPFFTTKEVGKGTGLGLSTVYGIVKQSNGAISVESAPGQGTTFKILFPAVGERVEESIRDSTAGPAAGGSETILLVEDEDAIRELGKEILEMHGYRVLVAGNAQKAAEIIRTISGRIDLLITDVVMPGMGGQDLAQMVQSVQPLIKILFVSGYAEDVILKQGSLPPGRAFLQKPYVVSALTQKVREVLAR